jgi:hypothetical protein
VNPNGKPNGALVNQTTAAVNLITQLKALGVYGDDVAVHDAIEGETDFFEALNDALGRIGEAEANVKAITAFIEELEERKGRFKKNAEAARAAVAVAMTSTGTKSKALPLGTVGVSPGQPDLIIDEETDIPIKYMVEQAPKLDKAALKKDCMALPQGQKIAGCHLTEPKTILRITRK